jgi:hypothetical protein
MSGEWTEKSPRKGALSERDAAHSEESTIFTFPNAEIRLIDEIWTVEDLRKIPVEVNLAPYFSMFFRRELVGAFTVRLMDMVQKYIAVLVARGRLDAPPNLAHCPAELQSLSNKRAFLERAEQLEANRDFRAIEELIRRYCVPPRALRDSFLRDILGALSQFLLEKFSLSKDADYVLLHENGVPVEDLCSVKFSTKLLLVATRATAGASYARYRTFLHSNRLSHPKPSLEEALKRVFRDSVSDRGDETALSSPTVTVRGDHSLRPQTRFLIHRSFDKSPPCKTNQHPKQRSRGGCSELPQNWRDFLSAERASLSAATKSPTRTLSARKRIEGYMEQFAELRRKNTAHDSVFNFTNPNKVMMAVLRREFPLFRDKSTAQIDAILRALGIDPRGETVSEEEFVRMSEVAQCRGDHRAIVEFVSRYLPFNEFGELERDGFARSLRFVLNGAANAEIVLSAVWSWLERNWLIENGVMVRSAFKSWYRSNKMAFVIMVSLIFGSNSLSWADDVARGVLL